MVYFHGPVRMSIYEPNEVEGEKYTNFADYAENMRCSVGDHRWPARAFVTIIPNKFNLCAWHYSEFYPGLHQLLKTHYESEPGRDWF